MTDYRLCNDYQLKAIEDYYLVQLNRIQNEMIKLSMQEECNIKELSAIRLEMRRIRIK